MVLLGTKGAISSDLNTYEILNSLIKFHTLRRMILVLVRKISWDIKPLHSDLGMGVVFYLWEVSNNVEKEGQRL